MENKAERIKYEKVEDEIVASECFGWVHVSTTDMHPDNTVLLTMTRDDTNPNIGALRKLEKQYKNISRLYPINAFVLVGVGLIFLIAYFILRKFPAVALVLIILALTFISLSIFTGLTFLIIMLKRKYLLESIKKEAGQLSGKVKQWPYNNNVMKAGEKSWVIRNNLK